MPFPRKDHPVSSEPLLHPASSLLVKHQISIQGHLILSSHLRLMIESHCFSFFDSSALSAASQSVFKPFVITDFVIRCVFLCTKSLLTLSLLGHSMPKGTKQGDDQRWRLLDNHQHRQGGIHFLRGHGPCPLACHPRACGRELTGTNSAGFYLLNSPTLFV